MAVDEPGPDSTRSALYAALWAGSADKPYDEVREAAVVERRFGPVAPALRRLRELSDQPLRVLDFGCADGHTAQLILEAAGGPPLAYYGCDLYPLDATAARLTRAGFRTKTCSTGLAGMPDDWRDFDAILALSCMQYVPDTAGTLMGLRDRLRPGGLFVGYFYDAPPMRRETDRFLRETFSAQGTGADPAQSIDRLRGLAALNCAIRDAVADTVIDVPAAVPELGIPAGPMRLQQFLIDHVLFAWAPAGASAERAQWALGEMLLTGPQVYLNEADIRRLMDGAGLTIEQVDSGPSGHLVLATKG